MEYQVIEEEEGLRVTIQGSMKETEGAEVLEGVRPLLSEKCREISIDLNGVDFISSTSLGALVKLYNEVNNMGGSVSLVEVPPNIKEMLRVTHLDKFFSVEIDADFDELSLLDDLDDDGSASENSAPAENALKNVLIIDPSSLARRQIKEVLTELSVQDKEAESAQQALGFLREKAPPLLVMEMELPDSN